MVIRVLMVAEKPSICTSIAHALRGGRDMETHGRSPPVHEFQGQFRGVPAAIKVTSVTGHVFSTDFPASFQRWESVEPVELFDAPVVRLPEGKGGIVHHLERESKGMDILVLWLDCDREGENICFEVISCVEKNMNTGLKGQQTIFRAKFSAVTPKDIEKAMQNLVSPDKNESDAVEARQELDLKVGVAFSRFQTRYFQGKYGDLDSSVISYGPCQTPTLGFCVDRYDEMQTFAAETFWCLDIGIEQSQGGFQRPVVVVDWNRGRLFDQTIVETFLKLVQEDKQLLCTGVKSSETRRMRPQPMNTVEMLKVASKSLGIGPHAAMRAAEHLYLSGYISYPRTESTTYPSSFDVRESLQALRSHPDLCGYINTLLNKGFSNPRQGHDAGDHPPITPVAVARDLTGDEERIYDMIFRHFLATVSRDAIFLSTKVSFEGLVSKEIFSVTGKRELDPGFLVLHGGWSGEEDILEIPEYIAGQKYSIVNSKIRSGQTSPPGYLTESELIGMMEKHGIGTDASIPTHINNILVRNYVTLGQGRTLVPTTLGVVLVHGYQCIDPALVMPDVRATIEKFCDMVAKGVASKDEVVAHSLKNFEAKFRYFCARIEAMDSLFEASFSPLAKTGKFLSKCGKCLRYMRYIPLKPQRLHCPNCEVTYSLPQNGTIKLYKELKCPLDNFELVLFSLGNSAEAQGKSYPLCPYCYNSPPTFEDHSNSGGDSKNQLSQDQSAEHAKMGCNSCMHPSCKQSALQNGMCECPGTSERGEACTGTLILDVNSKPNWKLGCNKCNVLLRFHANIHKITPNKIDCPECGMRTAVFEFNKVKAPLPGGATSYIGCIACDDFLNSLTQIVVGRSVSLLVLRQQRHKRGAGGRGRHGRGRGRGGKVDLRMTFDGF